MELKNIRTEKREYTVQKYVTEIRDVSIADWECPICKKIITVNTFTDTPEKETIETNYNMRLHYIKCKYDKKREALQLVDLESCRNCKHGKIYNDIDEDEHYSISCLLIHERPDYTLSAMVCGPLECKVCSSWENNDDH